jgi:hypothetical protein
MGQCLDWMIDQAAHIELIDDVGSGVACRDVPNDNDVDHEQDHIRSVELPDPPENPRRPDNEAALQYHFRVDERRGIAGYEDEQIRGAAESVIPQRDPAHDIVWDVIQKDEPVRQSQNQVEPNIMTFRRRGGVSVRGNRRLIGFGDAIEMRNTEVEDRHRNFTALQGESVDSTPTNQGVKSSMESYAISPDNAVTKTPYHDGDAATETWKKSMRRYVIERSIVVASRCFTLD